MTCPLCVRDHSEFTIDDALGLLPSAVLLEASREFDERLNVLAWMLADLMTNSENTEGLSI